MASERKDSANELIFHTMADMSSCELDLANGIKKKCHSNDLNVIKYR